MTGTRDVVLVSGCLLGLPCRYDAQPKANFADAAVRALIPADAVIVPICPEQMGGLQTPRPKAAITSGDGRDVLDGHTPVVVIPGEPHAGRDVTPEYVRGAESAIAIARLTGATRAILMERSPSCGTTRTSTVGGKIDGMGVTAALLHLNGIQVIGVEPDR